ncbi:hypothetical protein MU582_01465 [Nocardioidaceae bacterium SCSIO 66511]|nr:hypothetical protein MU582_01465 [Nocardioidaceae bacterium SCSIO 66511]
MDPGERCLVYEDQRVERVTILAFDSGDVTVVAREADWAAEPSVEPQDAVVRLLVLVPTAARNLDNDNAPSVGVEFLEVEAISHVT